MPSQRLFVGIELDGAVRKACDAIAKRLQRTGFQATYEDESKLHVTLAFLGNVESARYGAICQTMNDAVARCARFEIDLDKLAAFPHERKPRIVYIGARRPHPAYRALANGIHGAYRAIGFDFAGDPVAHVTVARVRPPAHPLPAIELARIGLIVDRVTLFESIYDNKKRTSRYEVRSSTALTG